MPEPTQARPGETLTLKDRVEQFATLRDREAAAKKAMEAAEARFRLETADLFRALREATEERASLEQAIRDEARMEYLTHGDKNPAPGVSIRLNKRLEYDPARALDYALDTHTCVTLDKRAFEKAAGDLSLDFVQTVTEPTVVVASNLFAAFMEAKP